MVRFFDPGKSYLSIKEEIDSEIQRVLASGKLILQEDVEKFEENLAKFVGTKYAIGVNSGTDAMYLTLWALGFDPGCDLITSGHTFVASLEVGRQLGGRTSLVDIGDDGLIDVSELKKKIDEGIGLRTFIIPVSMMGDVADIPAIEELLSKFKKNRPIIIEDACQAFGGERGGKRAGSFGKAGCFSFYPAKILGCYGDGGAITTNDKSLYEELIKLRNHYKPTYKEWGINSRLDNIQAAVLNVKLKYIPSALERRKIIAERYLSDLLNVGLPVNRLGRVWQDFVISFASRAHRDAMFNFLKSKGIESMKNEYDFPVEKPPKSAFFEETTLRIPCNENLTDDEVEEVITVVNSYHA